MPTIGEWARAALDCFEPGSALASCVHCDYDNVFARNGDTVRVGSVPARLDTLSSSFVIRNAEESRSLPELVEMFVKPCMVAMARAIDRLIVNNVCDRRGDVSHISSLTRSNAVASLDMVSDILTHNNLPLANRHLILDAESESEVLRSDGGWGHALDTGLSPVMIPELDDEKRTALAWQQDAIALVTRPLIGRHHADDGSQFCVVDNGDVGLRLNMQYDVNYAGTIITVIMLLGSIILNPSGIVVLQDQ